MENLLSQGFRDAISFIIRAERATIRDALTVGAAMVVKLFESYLRYKIASREQELRYKEALKKGLGGEGEDHEVDDPTEGSLCVKLRCFTVKKFLEVLEDFKSGRTKERLQKEFLNIGIKTEGLVVEIKNTEGVKNESKR